MLGAAFLFLRPCFQSRGSAFIAAGGDDKPRYVECIAAWIGNEIMHVRNENMDVKNEIMDVRNEIMHVRNENMDVRNEIMHARNEIMHA